MIHLSFQPYYDEPQEWIMCALPWGDVPDEDTVVDDYEAYDWDRDKEEIVWKVDPSTLCPACLACARDSFD